MVNSPYAKMNCQEDAAFKITWQVSTPLQGCYPSAIGHLMAHQ